MSQGQEPFQVSNASAASIKTLGHLGGNSFCDSTGTWARIPGTLGKKNHRADATPVPGRGSQSQKARKHTPGKPTAKMKPLLFLGKKSYLPSKDLLLIH